MNKPLDIKQDSFTKKVFVFLIGLLFFIPAQSFATVQVGNDFFDYLGVQYDFPTAGESTWYYKATSGDAPAISHVTFVVNLDCMVGLEGGTWDGTDKNNLNAGGGLPVIGKDNATGYYGVKFDQGFNSGEERYYYFTVDGNYAPGSVKIVSKAGSGFDEGYITGPNSDCNTENPNNPPVAVDDSTSTSEDTPVVIAASANDSDPDGNLDPTTATVITTPSNGSVINNGDGTFTYVPDPDFFGTDTFDYQICDTNALCDTATVTITVTAVNDTPTANDDSASTNQSTPVTIPVLSNDTAGASNEDQTLTVGTVSDPANGTASVNPDGTITYTPDPGFSGTDTFTYTACDSNGACDTATVTVTVNATTANNDSYSTAEDTSITVASPGVLGNDTDENGDPLTVTGNTQPANGTVVQNADGSFTYTPNANFCGVDTYTYTISDGNGGTDTATVSITVVCVNDGPVAVDDSYNTSEDTVLNIPATGVLGNDSDLDGDSLTVDSYTQPSNGSVTMNSDGSFSYTPNPNYCGTDSFTYTMTDGNGGTDTATVTIQVLCSNDAPTAVDDAYSTNEDTPITVTAPGILGNDSDGDQDTLIVASNTQPSNGTLSQNADGSFTYTPNANYCGPDSYDYTVSDGNGGTATATVSITVLCVNDPPTANDDSASVNEDESVSIPVLGNDTDPDGDDLTVTGTTAPANGTVVVNEDGTITYTPNPDFYGEDTFTYTITDGNGGTDTATVTVTIINVNDPPVANDDTAVTDEDISVTIPVLGNDSDPENDPLTVTGASDPANGTVVINGDGTITYTPDQDYYGEDTFTYTISDGNGGTDTATVTVVIGALNDPPVAVDDSATTNEDTPVVIDSAANDYDVDGNLDPSSATVLTSPANGSVINNGDGTFTYVPNPNYNGTDSFDYQICDTDGMCDSATVTITIIPVNDAPDAVDDNYSVSEDSSVTIDAPGVLNNDSDVDGDDLTVTGYTDPSNGTVTMNDDGSFTYTPAPNFCGTDSFTYTVSDGNGGTDTATVTITVVCVNDAPVAVDDQYTTNEDTPFTVDATGVLGNDSDIDGDTLTVVSNTAPSNGTVTQNADGSLTYTPNANYCGTDSYNYTVSDGNGGSATATVNITVICVNDPPVAADDSYNTSEDTPLTVPAPGILGNDSDIEGDALTITANTQTSNGTVVVNSDGSMTYTPNANYCGVDTFTYTISDGNGGTDSATVTINIACVNDAPDAVDDSYTVNEDETLTVAAPGTLGNDSDVDGDNLTVVSNTNPSHGTVTQNADGSLTYTPEANYCGNDSYTYTISDGNGGSDTATVNITVICVNDPPVAVDDSYVTQQDTALNVSAPGILVNDSDIDGDAIYVSNSDATSQFGGTVSTNGDGSFTYTPASGFAGYDTYTYTISDGNGGTDSATVTIEVEATNNRSLSIDLNSFFFDGTYINSGVATVTNQSDGYDIQIVDAAIEFQYRLPKGGGWVSIPVVDGTCVFNPAPLFQIVDQQVMTFNGCQVSEEIPLRSTIRVIAKVKIYGRIKGGGKASGWFLSRETGYYPTPTVNP